jgi:EpsI family protein
MSIWEKNKYRLLLYAILLFGAVNGVYGLNQGKEPGLPGIYPERSFSKWSSKTLENNIYEKALLNTGKINKRVYFNNKDFLWYVLVESLHGHHGQHQPEVCYTGNGWSVENRYEVVINRNKDPIMATKMIIRRKNEQRLVVYWYTNGNMTTGNFYQRVFQHVWDDWAGKPYSAWTFHRISIPIVESLEQSTEIINSFIGKIKFNPTGETV